MYNAELQRIKKAFKTDCFDWTPGQTLPVPPYLNDKNKGVYTAKSGETLETIANDIINNKDNKYWDISSKFKNCRRDTNDAPWKFLATYNFGVSTKEKINWICCEMFGFNINVNLSSDHTTFTFKGGEKLYYPTMLSVSSGSNKTGVVSNNVPGYILFPSFATPSIVQSGTKISLLILSQNELTPIMVNTHLKIVSWEKPIDKTVCEIKDISYNEPNGYKNYKPLLVEKDLDNCISCKPLQLSESIVDEESQFAFIPDADLISELKNDYQLNVLNKVTINLEYLNDIDNGFYNLFWINKGQELEDAIVQKRLKSEQFLGKRIPKNSNGQYYCWEVEENAFYLENIRDSLPIAAYHPLLITNKEYCNFAHLGDLHCVSRLSLLKLSNAKVIDHKDIEPIGSLINDYVSTVKSLLFQEDKIKDVDAFLISGDLIDFMYNFYPVDLIAKREQLRSEGKYDEAQKLTAKDFYNTPDAIRDAVGVGDEADVMDKYEMGVDLITLYGMILQLYQELHKPVFIVTGNHDAYEMPYGVSPRIGIPSDESTLLPRWMTNRGGVYKPNDGIPADMNLTFYEAILVYGEHYPVVVKAKNFTPRRMKHIYELFIPIKDFVLSNKNWTLIGLGWGDAEDLIDVPFWQDQGSPGHLPRANETLTIPQRELVDFAVRIQKKIILFSHFTFVSFDAGIPSQKNPKGIIQYTHFGKNDMGTFELQRRETYKYFVDNTQISIALSGHAHRRGLYSIERNDDDSAHVSMFDFDDLLKVKGTKIVVSDSSGSISKFNGNSEFEGKGMCTPSMTKVMFKQDGNIDRLEKVVSTNHNAKPRLAVALDYMYIVGNTNFIKTFKSKEYDTYKICDMATIEFNVELSEKMYHMGITLRSLSIFSISGNTYKEYPLTINNSLSLVKVNKATNEKYRSYNVRFTGNKEEVGSFLNVFSTTILISANAFLSCKLTSNNETINKEYNCISPYNFPVQLKRYNNIRMRITYLECIRINWFSERPESNI